jgi:threonyl-tRNA synthetase
MEQVRETVAELYSGRFVYEEITESGFFCDFDMSEPLNSRKVAEINTQMSNDDIPCAYELSGTLHGLTRVRGFTQDDAHIICTPEQVEDEVAFALKFSLYILRSFGLTEFKPYVSTKPKKKSIGSDGQWAAATEVLKKYILEEGAVL